MTRIAHSAGAPDGGGATLPLTGAPSQRTHGISRLVAWYRGSGQIPEGWAQIRIFDTRDPGVTYVAGAGRGWRVRRSALHATDDFREQFDRYLRCGYSWVNLSLYAKIGPDLILATERPREMVGVPIGMTSVNYSGPSLDLRTGQARWEDVRIVDDG